MDLKFAPEDEQFRADVREWVADNIPESFKGSWGGVAGGGAGKREDYVAWRMNLAGKGWLCPSWPEAHGGTGWSLSRQTIFQQELANVGAPGAGMGPSMVGPLLIEYGTDEQKEKYLPKIASGENVWCQGYSEPNSGSDLASLALRAELDGDHYIVNGQKIWTSGADAANMIFFLARTDTSAKKKQIGISFLVTPMDAPGLRIEPIHQINGESGFFETFFQDVRVPVGNLVGQENQGWTIAKRLLAHERGGFTGGAFRKTLSRLIDLARDPAAPDAPATLADPSVRRRLAQLSMELDAMRATSDRSLTKFLQGEMPGSESSILKLFGSELFQRMGDLALEILGPSAQAWYDSAYADTVGKWPVAMVSGRAYTIFSGTSEIQRNIISERVLGMPR